MGSHLQKKKRPEGEKVGHEMQCVNGDPNLLDPWLWDTFEAN
jgi:hypothetical protein